MLEPKTNGSSATGVNSRKFIEGAPTEKPETAPCGGESFTKVSQPGSAHRSLPEDYLDPIIEALLGSETLAKVRYIREHGVDPPILRETIFITFGRKGRAVAVEISGQRIETFSRITFLRDRQALRIRRMTIPCYRFEYDIKTKIAIAEIPADSIPFTFKVLMEAA